MSPRINLTDTAPLGRRGGPVRGRLGRGATALLVALAGVVAAVGPVAAQDDDVYIEYTVRISARLLDDGRVEFALQQRDDDGAWAQRVLPRTRFFPTDRATVGRWLNSSTLSGLRPYTVRISARLLDDGRVEFALQQRDDDGAWAQRVLPRTRFFPTDRATVGRWLNSSTLELARGATTKVVLNELTYYVDPDARYVDVDLSGHGHGPCAVTTAGEVVCDYLGHQAALDGTYTAVSRGGEYGTGRWICALATDGSIDCADHRGSVEVPEGTYTAVDVGWSSACALTTEGAIACWGDNTYGQTDAPEGTFTAIAVGGMVDVGAPYSLGMETPFGCAVATDGAISCWGDNSRRQASPPRGAYTAVSAGDWHACAVTTRGAIDCWGLDRIGETSAKKGTFSAVASGHLNSCGLRSDGRAACWGEWNSRVTTPPAGAFSKVVVAAYDACGLRPDGTLECWGSHSDDWPGIRIPVEESG